jgi:hypothetical protein
MTLDVISLLPCLQQALLSRCLDALHSLAAPGAPAAPLDLPSPPLLRTAADLVRLLCDLHDPAPSSCSLNNTAAHSKDGYPGRSRAAATGNGGGGGGGSAPHVAPLRDLATSALDRLLSASCGFTLCVLKASSEALAEIASAGECAPSVLHPSLQAAA